MRPFGQDRRDLEVAFSPQDPAGAVTAVLAACGEKNAEAAEYWGWPVSRRIASLLEIVRLTESAETLGVVSVCGAEACRKPVQMELRFADLAALAPNQPGAQLEWTSRPGRTLQFRLATGADQRAWRELGSEITFACMAETLLAEPAPEGVAGVSLEALGEALEEFDPLTAFRVEAACPECGTVQWIEVDLQAICLTKLARCQRELAGDVHRLAKAYGWTERDIIKIPAWRRRQYLELIEAEAS